MKYLINLFLVFALFYGELEAMARGGHNNSPWIRLDESAERIGGHSNSLFRELNAAMNNHYNDLVKILVKEACQNRFKDWSKEQKAILLFYAVENGLEEVVENCADSRFNLDIRGWDGKTPLLIASERGYDTIVEYLLTSGADPNIVDTRTGFSALMFASWRGNENLVRTLIRSKANVDALSYMGCSPLSLAMGSNHQEVVRILKDAGADVYLENQNGDTPISMALYYGQKLAENDREKTKWNEMARVLQNWDEPRDGIIIVEPPVHSSVHSSVRSSVRSSIRSFFRSFFRRQN